MKRIYVIVIVLIICIGMINSALAKRDKQKKKQSKCIPGIVAVDVHGNFTNKGFVLQTELGTELSYWKCVQKTSEHYFDVTIYGEDPFRITSIVATALNYTNKSTASVVKDFLSYVATIPYDGSKPIEARQWVFNNIDKGGSMVIGTVKFEIIVNLDSPRTRILEMSPVEL